VIAAVLTVRLVGGRSWRSGRLEIWHNGTWGSVCRLAKPKHAMLHLTELRNITIITHGLQVWVLQT
jgi:hypothetical protein